ncbi:16781_t:CDS:2 [Cetraspora pellucida]|uniref:16781_t:CDS:1 n=1 Tax=Cetraspora pellucida TaxID=1433469 RepID=A0A9N9NFT6_9GLOM|nr:16781_t:CDS:2 [Cetraspora pellucida]
MILDFENDDDTHLHTSLLLPNLDQIEKQFKIAISDSLNKYWHNFYKAGLQQKSTPIVTKIMQNLFFEDIFGVQNYKDMLLDEVAQYLKTILINYNANSWQ